MLKQVLGELNQIIRPSDRLEFFIPRQDDQTSLLSSHIGRRGPIEDRTSTGRLRVKTRAFRRAESQATSWS